MNFDFHVLVFKYQSIRITIVLCLNFRPKALSIHFPRRAARHVPNIAKSDYELRHVCPSVCPHRITMLTLDRFSRNLIFEYFFENIAEKIQV